MIPLRNSTRAHSGQNDPRLHTSSSFSSILASVKLHQLIRSWWETWQANFWIPNILSLLSESFYFITSNVSQPATFCCLLLSKACKWHQVMSGDSNFQIEKWKFFLVKSRQASCTRNAVYWSAWKTLKYCWHVHKHLLYPFIDCVIQCFYRNMDTTDDYVNLPIILFIQQLVCEGDTV